MSWDLTFDDLMEIAEKLKRLPPIVTKVGMHPDDIVELFARIPARVTHSVHAPLNGVALYEDVGVRGRARLHYSDGSIKEIDL